MAQKVVKEISKVSKVCFVEKTGIIQSAPFICYTNKLNPVLTDPRESNLISSKSNISKCGRVVANLIKQNRRKFLWSNCFLNNLSSIQLHLSLTCTRILYTVTIIDQFILALLYSIVSITTLYQSCFAGVISKNCKSGGWSMLRRRKPCPQMTSSCLETKSSPTTELNVKRKWNEEPNKKQGVP